MLRLLKSANRHYGFGIIHKKDTEISKLMQVSERIVSFVAKIKEEKYAIVGSMWPNTGKNHNK